MRVLFVGPFPWPSHQGSQAYLAGQASALARRGHDVHLAVYGAGGGAGDSGSDARDTVPGVTLHRARRIPLGDFRGGGLHPSRPLHDLALARRVRKLSRRLKPHVIHAHNVEGPVAAALAATGLPIVYDLHTQMADELADHLPRRLQWLGRPVGRFVDALALRASTAGCAISEPALEVFRAAGLPCALVGPGVDPDELVARSEAPVRQDRHVLYTGNLDRYQNLDTLFAALDGTGIPLRIVTGSDGPVPPGVEVLRSTDFRDAIDALSSATVAVIPRATCAGFPIKLLNQLGMGVPTVMLASAAVELPGVVACEPHALADTLRALLDDPSRCRQLGSAARAEILANWTWDARMGRLEALYARISSSR